MSSKLKLAVAVALVVASATAALARPNVVPVPSLFECTIDLGQGHTIPCAAGGQG